MSKQTHDATESQLNTGNTSFRRVNGGGQMLFAVNDGVSMLEAIEMAQCYMVAARDITAQTAETNDPSGPMWGAHYLCELATAVLDSLVQHHRDMNEGIKPMAPIRGGGQL